MVNLFSVPFNVEKCIVIQKPVAEVFSFMCDFGHWPKWSPWLCQEPDCPVTVEGRAGTVGHAQTWQGQHIGEGTITIAALAKNQRIDYALNIIKPWKSKSQVSFSLGAQSDSATLVTWTMQGSLPVFMFFMRKAMAALVGDDYLRGLSMLKDCLEQGKLNSSLEFLADADKLAFYYVGRRRSCKLSDIGPSMASVFSELEKMGQADALPAPDFKLSFYHRFDPVRDLCDYTAAYGYKQKPDQVLPMSVAKGHVPAHHAMQVIHTGAYKHLGNAWSAIMGRQRSLKRKGDRRVKPYEIYENDLGSVEESALKTQIFVPAAPA